jgi:hypothetical protein
VDRYKEMKIDKDKAREIFRREAEKAEQPTAAGEHEWIEVFEEFSLTCSDGKSQTHIAFLCTAMLARTTEAEADIYALKTKAGTPGAYSARGLVKGVVAPLAKELEIDIGVSGREPLNNQPYFQKDRVDEEIIGIVRYPDRARAVLKILDKLDRLSPDDIGLALRAFIRVRRKLFQPYPEPPNRYDRIPLGDLPVLVEKFVSTDSEGGKRAQAVCAGLIEAVLSEHSVVTGRINDPDRHLPGDIGVRSPKQEGYERVIEVRDKQVNEEDLIDFASKALRAGIFRAGVIGIAHQQPEIETNKVKQWALERGLSFTVYLGWWATIADLASWTPEGPEEWLNRIPLCVRNRLIEAEVSVEAVEEWDRLTG